MATNTLNFELMAASIEINQEIQYIKDFYPELLEHNFIKKLVSISDKWDRIFSDFYSIQGRRQ